MNAMPRPRGPNKVHTSLNLSPAARIRLEEMAARDRRSLSQVVEDLVMQRDAELDDYFRKQGAFHGFMTAAVSAALATKVLGPEATRELQERAAATARRLYGRSPVRNFPVIYGVLWAPKVQVQVVDRFNPGLTGGAVANVPIGVGVVASMSSRVGGRTIDLMETAFSAPNDVRYSRAGMIYGAKLFERMRAFRITDPIFDANAELHPGLRLLRHPHPSLFGRGPRQRRRHLDVCAHHLSAEPRPFHRTPARLRTAGHPHLRPGGQ